MEASIDVGSPSSSYALWLEEQQRQAELERQAEAERARQAQLAADAELQAQSLTHDEAGLTPPPASPTFVPLQVLPLEGEPMPVTSVDTTAAHTPAGTQTLEAQTTGAPTPGPQASGSPGSGSDPTAGIDWSKLPATPGPFLDRMPGFNHDKIRDIHLASEWNGTEFTAMPSKYLAARIMSHIDPAAPDALERLMQGLRDVGLPVTSERRLDKIELPDGSVIDVIQNAGSTNKDEIRWQWGVERLPTSMQGLEGAASFAGTRTGNVRQDIEAAQVGLTPSSDGMLVLAARLRAMGYVDAEAVPHAAWGGRPKDLLRVGGVGYDVIARASEGGESAAWQVIIPTPGGGGGGAGGGGTRATHAERASRPSPPPAMIPDLMWAFLGLTPDSAGLEIAAERLRAKGYDAIAVPHAAWGGKPKDLLRINGMEYDVIRAAGGPTPAWQA